MRNKEEYDIQTEFVRYLQLVHPDLLYTISPAGMIASAGMAMKMTRMGYRKGTPDILFFEPRGGFHGLFIEFKKPGAGLTGNQPEVISSLLLRNYAVYVCDRTDKAIELLKGYLSLPAPYITQSQKDDY